MLLGAEVHSIRVYNLAESIEDLIEVDENLPFGDFGDVVHALARVVPDARILVGEAGKHGGDNLL